MKKKTSEKLELISKYLLKTWVKMFTPGASKEFLYLLEDLRENEESFARKIDQAHQSLQTTSDLVGRLEIELKTKVERLTVLKEDHKRYSKLAQIEEDKSRAVIEQLEKSINKGKVPERFVSFIINLVAGVILFVLGFVANPYLTTWLG
jgi:hypothetical protein